MVGSDWKDCGFPDELSLELLGLLLGCLSSVASVLKGWQQENSGVVSWVDYEFIH